VRLTPQAVGGGQEKGRRAGTENVPALVGLGAAVRVATNRLAAEAARLGALRDRFEEGLRAAIPGVRFNATIRPGVRRLPTVTSAVFPAADGETMLAALDLEGIAASAGSACASGTTKPSAVLLACGLSPADVRATLRFSFGRTTRDDDIDRLLETIPRIVARQAAVARA
jgi:cysteine desulfurase